MTLETVLAKRRSTYQKKLSKYAKYVMNDHFVIALMFLLGALAYQYSNFIKTLTPDFFWGKIVAAFLLAILLFFGRIATMATAADQVFLVTQEAEWQTVIKEAKKRSMVVPGVLLLLLTAVFLPIIFVGQAIALADVTIIFFIGLSLKWVHLGIEEVALRFGTIAKVKSFKWFLYGWGVASYLLAFFVHPIGGLALALVGVFIFESQMRPLRSRLLDWEKMVTTETTRMAKINRFINLFIDAPTGKENSKRRLYLDGVVRILSGSLNPYQYLFARVFMRGSSYFGLYVRLTLIGTLVLAMSQMPAFNIVLGVLLVYLTGFQMLPLFRHVGENVMVRLYPQPEEKKQEGFSRLMMGILFVQGFIFSLATVWGTNLMTGAIALVVNSVFIFFFAKIYVVNRIKKRRGVSL